MCQSSLSLVDSEVSSAIFLRASIVRKAWCPLNCELSFSCLHRGNISQDSRHENIIEREKTGKGIICNYLGTRICEKVIGLPFVDVETDSGDMTGFQGTLCLDQKLDR